MRGAFEFAVPLRGAGVLNRFRTPTDSARLCRTRRACLSLPLRRALRDRRSEKWSQGWPPFFDFFPFFSVLEKTVKKRTLQKSTFSGNFGAADVDFRPFWLPKRVPGGYFFGVFLKTSIFSKSCSRCGGSTVFKGQTFEKSIRRATPNGTGKKKRQ